MANNPGNKLREIERLRGFAILIVVIHHTNSLRAFLPRLFQSTWSGVDLFFVISGFVVTRSLLRRLPPPGARLKVRLAVWGDFLRRRIFRIFPLCFTFAGILFFLSSQFNLSGTLERVPLANLFFRSILLMVSNYTFVQIPPHSHFLTFWSLAVEDQFYILLPLLLIFVTSHKKRIAVLIGVIFIVAIGLRIVISPHWVEPNAQNWRYYHLPSHHRFDSLAAGVLLAYLLSLGIHPFSVPPSSGRRIFSVGGALFILVALPGSLSVPNRILFGYVVLWTLSAYLVYLAAWDRGYVFELKFVGTFLEYLGSRSYALYLTHTVADAVFTELQFRHGLGEFFLSSSLFPTLLRIATYTGVTLAFTELAHRGIEKPFMRWGQSPKRFSFSLPGGNLTNLGEEL